MSSKKIITNLNKDFRNNSFISLWKVPGALLNPNGILLFNKLAANKKDKEQAAQFFEVFKKVFPKGDYLDVNGNWMLINDARFIR